MKCELLEDMVDIEVKIRTLQGTHTLTEDREYCTLKLRPWGGQVKPFEAFKVELSRYIKRRETIATATTASVTPILRRQKRKRKKGNT